MRLTPVIFLLGITFSFSARAGHTVSDEVVNGGLIYARYIYQFPGGDLADRFGNNSNVGAGFNFKLSGNWLVGAEGGFIFGGQVKQDSLFKDLLHPDNLLFGLEGLPANVTLSERGFEFQARGGKILPLFGPNPNSGILVSAGIGFIQHKIRIQVNKEFEANTLPQLDKQYRKGYDRLSNGLNTTQFLGYVFLGNNKMINFYFGFEFTQGWTKNRRSFNFDTREQDTRQRQDFFYGLKAGWIIPIYEGDPDQIYTY